MKTPVMTMQPTLQVWPRLRAVFELAFKAVVFAHKGVAAVEVTSAGRGI
ncbi:hypothetical protein GZH52_02705 [Crenobacter sp. HX-7-9]|uniref:Uncharacterized protein n=1 Tax=Crenobacter caeni TaxID=2705474 RepID=A0A6B2KP07_9NEIS|nr:hypothetical protein [Crenobacter caeni]